MSDLSSRVAELSSQFSGRLLLPDNPAWDAARRVHNGFVDKRPALVAQCRGSADVAMAVRLAREAGLAIAVRGGGHNVGGRSTIDDGLLIDLSPMQYVYVDSTARKARAAGGTLWGQLNRETQVHGLATTGGVVSSTGVGGLTLGGGLGWLMPKHGMALDNVLEVEMVLADGSVVRASAEEHPDLFWAARGGGGNFGVASSFEFRLHEVGPMVNGGLVAWPVERARDVLRMYREMTHEATDDLMLVAALITGPDAATKLVAIAAGHFGDNATAERTLGRIKSFGQPAMDAMGPIPYAGLNAMLDASYPAGARNYWKSHFCEEMADGAIDAIVDAFMRCPSPLGQIVIEHFHGAATRVPPTETAYALRSSGFNVLVLSQWTDAAGDASGQAWARASYESLAPFVGEKRYLNYLDHDDVGDGALAAAYGPNLRRLQAIKHKYDPDNAFRQNVNIPPRADASSR
jgi:FAD/FMN-containing dehydrogenase